jgi:hypothetical protein
MMPSGSAQAIMVLASGPIWMDWPSTVYGPGVVMRLALPLTLPSSPKSAVISVSSKPETSGFNIVVQHRPVRSGQ